MAASAADFGTGIQTVPFTLIPYPASLLGIVTAAQTGSPIAGTLVQVFVIGMTVPIKSTLTDDNGQYRITGLLSATYTIIVFARNFTTQSLNVTLMNGKEKSIFNIICYSTIIGTITDYLTGILPSKILIQVFNLEEELMASTVTDFSGKYKLTGLPIGTIIVKARSKSFILLSQVVTLKANETKTVNFILVRREGVPAEIVVNLQQEDFIYKILDQLMSISTKRTFIWIKDSHNVRVHPANDQSLVSLQINLQGAIATVASIIFNEPIITNKPRVQTRRQRSRKNQIKNKELVYLILKILKYPMMILTLYLILKFYFEFLKLFSCN